MLLHQVYVPYIAACHMWVSCLNMRCSASVCTYFSTSCHRNAFLFCIYIHKKFYLNYRYNYVHLPSYSCREVWLYLKGRYPELLVLLATILPLLIIPFRAATTWCASTGDGHCVDPTLLHNTSNATSSILDINQACITASSIQWIIASLAYMVNAIWVLWYLRPFRYMWTLPAK